MSCRIPKLFELMKTNNITAKKLSVSIGASEGNISDWKSGKAIPSAEKLVLIADFFDVSIDYLLERTDISHNNIPKIDPQLEEAIKLFSSLPSEKRKQVLKIIKTFADDE